jgi:hypothetical protein
VNGNLDPVVGFCHQMESRRDKSQEPPAAPDPSPADRRRSLGSGKPTRRANHASADLPRPGKVYLPNGRSEDKGEDPALAEEAVQEAASVAMQGDPLERQARELANRGYSQYTIALLLGTRPTEVSSLLGIIQPSRKGPAGEATAESVARREAARQVQAERPVVPIEAIAQTPPVKSPERVDPAEPPPELDEVFAPDDQIPHQTEAEQEGPASALDRDDIYYEPEWDLWFNPDWDVRVGTGDL